MNLTYQDTSHLYLSTSDESLREDLKYYQEQYQYHLNEMHSSMKEFNHHVDKWTHFLYLIKECNKNLNW